MKPHRSNPAEPPLRPNSIRTLLTADTPIMLKTLVGILTRERGFEVVGTATDGRQAVHSAATLAPQLVLMDLHPPHLNGNQATRCLKQFENPPVVFMVTSDDSSSYRAVSTVAGVDAFVLKSGDLHAQLESKLQEWFGLKTANHHTSTSPCPADGITEGWGDQSRGS
jgi:two-component system NarL family response regulator